MIQVPGLAMAAMELVFTRTVVLVVKPNLIGGG